MPACLPKATGEALPAPLPMRAQRGVHQLLVGSQWDKPWCVYIYVGGDRPSLFSGQNKLHSANRRWAGRIVPWALVKDTCMSIWVGKKKKKNNLAAFCRQEEASWGGQARRHSPAHLCVERSTADFGRQWYPCPVCMKGGNRLLASKKQTIPPPQHLPMFMFVYRKI